MKTVLVADDEPMLLALLVAVLEDEGYAVVTARNGREALTAVARARPDLVLMDVMMPEMDGPAAYRTLRADADGRTPPIVLMSASHSRSVLDSGIDGFLRKPFDLDDLLALVKRMLDPG